MFLKEIKLKLNKKNYFKLFLLGLLTPLFIGSSFAFDLTSDEITYLDNNALNIGTFTNVSNYLLYTNNTNSTQNICVIFSGLVFNQSSVSYTIGPFGNSNASDYYGTIAIAPYPYFLFCTAVESNYPYFKILKGNSSAVNNLKFSTDKFWVINANKIMNGYLGFDIQGLLDSYNQCQTDLNDCDTITSQCLEDKGILSGQLATCNSDKDSLQNYNDALSSQLNECLNNQGTGGFGTGITLVNNSLFWYLDDNLLSLPITNNLFLPLGYQGALDSGNVLYISKLGEEEPTQYYFSEEDKISIIDILSYLFIFILGIGIIFSLIKLFKKIFTH